MIIESTNVDLSQKPSFCQTPVTGSTGLNVLSLFDGMSCGRLALDRAGIKVNNYFASEIDKYAIQVAKHNYPNMQHIGDVTQVKAKLLCLSEVYSYICNYDSNLQSNIREWEVLYWLDKNFTFSAKIGTQEPNEGQKVSKSSSIQRIEEVWFSNREMGSVRKFGDDTRSGSNGKENDIRTPQQLQCSEWRYDNDIYRRYKEENIGIAIRETKNGDSEKKNFGNIEETVFKGKESENYFGENKKSNVEEGCSGELLEREGEDRFSRTVKKEKRNGRAEKNSFIDEIVRELCGWNETDGIAQDYWNILRLHKEEQVTVVEYEGGYHIFKGKIDLLCGGSPCQGFSFAGKQLAFDDPRSKLFFEFVRLKNECNPTYFMLENVKMKKEFEIIISKYMGVAPIEINSALLSAQNRVRLYWTNIASEPYGLFGDMQCMIPQPKDKGILLRDILESDVPDKYYLSEKMLQYFSNRAANFNQGKVNVREEEGKASCLTSSMASCDISDNFIKVDTNLRKAVNQDKANCFTAGGNSGGLHSDMTLIVASRGRNPENPKSREIGLNTEQHLEPRFDGKTNCLTSVQKDNLVMLNERQKANHKNGDEKANTFLSTSWKGSQANGMTLVGTTKIRRLTPTECERLQTVPDNKIICIFELCLDQVKNYVSAVEQNPKLLKLALSAEKEKLNEFVKLANQNTKQNNQKTKCIVQQGVDMMIQRQINQCTKINQKENNTTVNNVENIVMCKSQNQEAASVLPNAFINITEGRIMHFGTEELHRNDSHSTTYLNGKKPLVLFGSEIMELVKDVDAGMKKNSDMIFTSTILSALSISSLEQMLATYYLFAKNAITGYIPNATNQKSLSVQFQINDGYTSCVSDTQRYRMLGNGWTVSVVSHIFSFIPKSS